MSMPALKYLEKQIAELGDKVEHERWDTACRALLELAKHVGALAPEPAAVAAPVEDARKAEPVAVKKRARKAAKKARKPGKAR